MTLRVLGGASGGLGGGTPPVLQSAFQVPLLAVLQQQHSDPKIGLALYCDMLWKSAGLLATC